MQTELLRTVENSQRFLTDCWATLTGKDKQYAPVICNHGTQPRRGQEL